MVAHASSGPIDGMTFTERANGPGHELALRIFMVIVLAHWAEHLLQATQIYVLGWPVPEARGALGLLFPWLVSSEVLHYTYALVMLGGLWFLRPGFAGRADRLWWTVALAIQFWLCFGHEFLPITMRDRNRSIRHGRRWSP